MGTNFKLMPTPQTSINRLAKQNKYHCKQNKCPPTKETEMEIKLDQCKQTNITGD
jgi:hypothetical protein